MILCLLVEIYCYFRVNFILFLKNYLTLKVFFPLYKCQMVSGECLVENAFEVINIIYPIKVYILYIAWCDSFSITSHWFESYRGQMLIFQIFEILIYFYNLINN